MQKTDDYNQRCRFSALASGVWKSGNADSSRLPGPEETDIGKGALKPEVSTGTGCVKLAETLQSTLMSAREEQRRNTSVGSRHRRKKVSVTVQIGHLRNKSSFPHFVVSLGLVLRYRVYAFILFIWSFVFINRYYVHFVLFCVMSKVLRCLSIDI